MARRNSEPVKLSRVGPNIRLLLAAVLGALAAIITANTLPLIFALAVGWIIGVSFFLIVTGSIVARATPDHMRARARMQDPLRWVILAVLVGAAATSLVALGFMLHQKSGAATYTIVLAAGTVLASWLLTHTMFALHYAHMFYGDNPFVEGDQDCEGLAFPNEKRPDFWDFLYYAFVVGMTCQVSDVQVTARPIRRLTLAHGVLSFFFNTVILALAVNFIANAI